MKVFRYWLKQSAWWLVALSLCILFMEVVIDLNRVPITEWIYSAVLCLFCLMVFAWIDYFRYYKRHKRLQALKDTIRISLDALEAPEDQLEEDYRQLLTLVHEDKLENLNRLAKQKKDMTEYYGMWVHQIKTPIAAMRLLLQTEESVNSTELETELFRIEQYVEMALQYLRVDADSTDYILHRYELDDLVKEAVHKYAKLFIRKKINLSYEPLQCQVMTDEKWLVFVLEQLLSNAIKYTPSGTVSIYMEQGEDKVLVIEDTGIGIREEDLPRVCEKGYTGYNGHSDKRSTGIGLYLCKRILHRLSHEIRLESQLGVGTKVYISLKTVERVYE